LPLHCTFPSILAYTFAYAFYLLLRLTFICPTLRPVHTFPVVVCDTVEQHSEHLLLCAFCTLHDAFPICPIYVVRYATFTAVHTILLLHILHTAFTRLPHIAFTYVVMGVIVYCDCARTLLRLVPATTVDIVVPKLPVVVVPIVHFLHCCCFAGYASPSTAPPHIRIVYRLLIPSYLTRYSRLFGFTLLRWLLQFYGCSSLLYIHTHIYYDLDG